MKINVIGGVIGFFTACLFGTVEAFEGQALQILSGDLIMVGLANGSTTTVRLACIDAPEERQPYAGESAAFLGALLLGKPVRVEVIDRDSRGRLLGNVFRDDIWVNRVMVLSGHAWSMDAADCTDALAGARSEAAAERRGIWADTQPVAPWDFRRDKAAQRSSTLEEYVRYRLQPPDVCDQLRMDRAATASRCGGVPVPGSWLAGAAELNSRQLVQAAFEKQRRDSEAAAGLRRADGVTRPSARTSLTTARGPARSVLVHQPQRTVSGAGGGGSTTMIVLH